MSKKLHFSVVSTRCFITQFASKCHKLTHTAKCACRCIYWSNLKINSLSSVVFIYYKPYCPNTVHLDEMYITVSKLSCSRRGWVDNVLDLTGKDGCPSLQLCLHLFYNELIIELGNNFTNAFQKWEEYSRKKKTDTATASGCNMSLLVIVLIERSHVIQTAFFFFS